MGVEIPDIQLFVQCVLYITAFGTGLVVSIPAGLTNVCIIHVNEEVQA